MNEKQLAEQQLNDTIVDALKAALDHKWEDVVSKCETAAMLASHCNQLEKSGAG